MPTNLNWTTVSGRVDQLTKALAAGSLSQSTREDLQRELSFFQRLEEAHREVERISRELAGAIEAQSRETDPELITLFEQEKTELEEALNAATKRLESITYLPDEMTHRDVFLEIRAGAGGQEAALFASNLMRMYTNYALNKGWSVSIVSENKTDIGGYREVVLNIKGKEVYGHLKREAGVHRIQRVPTTEASGRIHTSTATVAVLPEASGIDIEIDPSDLRIDTFRSSGAGGQHVNVTDSAVRITHIPSGIVVSCQDERSQHKNKAKALKMLNAKLLSAEKEKQASETAEKRRQMVGTGMRAEKVRTYNVPQNRVTDHQIGLTLKSLDLVLEGDLNQIISQLMLLDAKDRSKHPYLKKLE